MLAENSDSVALKAQADIERFYSRVVGPTLANLAPEDDPASGEFTDFNAFLDACQTATHNALCEEARMAFALTMGAAFERHLRFWLSGRQPNERRAVQNEHGWKKVAARLSGLVSTDIAALPIAIDIEELWLLVNAARHGDGGSCTELLQKAPHLWQHLPADRLQSATDDGALTFHIRVTDADLSRYAHAVLSLWGYLGASKIGGPGRGFYVPLIQISRPALGDGLAPA